MSQRTFGGAIRCTSAVAAALAVLLACGGAAAQAPPAAGNPPDPFTVQNLIGDAVSLSNQDYPDVDRAIQRFKNTDVQGALEFLQQAKKKYPKLPPTELSMAKLHIFNRDGQSGRAWLEETVTKHPADPEAYLLLADLAFTEQRTTESSALFDKAAALVEKFAENEKRKKNFDIRVLAGRAAVYERRQQWQEANELLAKWAALDPESSAAHTRLGVTLFQLGKPAEAYAQFAKARELQPDAANPNVLLGQLYMQLQVREKANNDAAKAKTAFDSAKAAFEKAYAEDAKNEATARSYAEWLVQQNDLANAKKVAEALRKDAPESIAALMLDGVVAKMQGDLKAAEEALNQVLVLDPNNAGARNLLALILSESPNLTDQERALGHAQNNAERFQQNSQTNITLAWVLFKLGRAEEAKAFLQRGVQAGGMNADSYYLIARILVQQNQREQARRALTEMLQKAGAGMFMYRKEAEALLQELGGPVTAIAPGGPTETPAADSPTNPTNPTAPPATTPPATTPASP